LKKPHETTDRNQVSPRDSIDVDQAQYIAYEKSIESLAITDLQPFIAVPDYKIQTISPYPIIIKSPSFAKCIDGWEKIDEKRNSGEQQITCEIIHVQQDSEINVALWKMSVRVMPLGGPCLYPELVRNSSILFKMVIESQENPVIFSHGGPRRGLGYTENREENARILLADRLGKRPKTVSKYLNHAEYLNDDTFAELINQEIYKKFFESIQPNKRALVRSLTEDGKSAAEIEAEVSTNVLSWLQEFIDTGKVVYQPSSPPPETQSEPETPDETGPSEMPIETIQIDTHQPPVFKHGTGGSEETDSGNLSIDIVKAELATESENFLEVFTSQESDINQVESVVQAAIKQFALMLQKIHFLKGQMEKEDS